MAAERCQPSSGDWWRVSADHLARYQFAVSYAAGKCVLDAGTGFGYGAALLAAQGAYRVTGVDLDPGVIAAAQESYRLPNLAFHVDDCERLDNIRAPINLVVNFENIEHLKDPSAFLKAVVRLLDGD